MKSMLLFENDTSLNSKNRNSKVYITEEAIRKVPYIEYKNIDPSEYYNIQYLSKKVLEISMKENQSDEVAITYGLAQMNELTFDSEFIGLSLGTEHNVNVLRDTKSSQLIHGLRKCTVILLHNHPSLSLVSLQDIYFFLEFYAIQMLVIVSNLGAITYMSKSNQYSKYKAVDLLNICVEKHNKATNLKEQQEAVKYFINNCYSVGITYDDR